MADVIQATERRLWWRHLLSFLVAPVVMTLLIPLSIADSTGVRAPDLTSLTRIGLAIIGGLLIVVGLGLLVWTVVLFDRTGRARWESADSSESPSIWWCAGRTGTCETR